MTDIIRLFSEVYLENFSQIVFGIIFSMPRITAIFMTAGFLGKGVLPGIIRQVFIFSYCVFISPLVIIDFPIIMPGLAIILAIILKEFILGFLIGYIIGIGFWAIESAGFFIDNQRGASIASLVNPFSGIETSPLGMFFLQLAILLFFASGIFFHTLNYIFNTYSVWKVFSFFPDFSLLNLQSILGFMDELMKNAVLLASPVLLMMLLSEIGLAFANRFTPQLQVFFLSMPIKSGVAFFVLVIYFTFAIDNMQAILLKYVDFSKLLELNFSN